MACFWRLFEWFLSALKRWQLEFAATNTTSVLKAAQEEAKQQLTSLTSEASVGECLILMWRHLQIYFLCILGNDFILCPLLLVSLLRVYSLALSGNRIVHYCLRHRYKINGQIKPLLTCVLICSWIPRSVIWTCGEITASFICIVSFVV